MMIYPILGVLEADPQTDGSLLDCTEYGER